MAEPVNIEWQTVGPIVDCGFPNRQSTIGNRQSLEVVTDALERCGEVGEFLDRAAAEGESVLLVVNDGHRATRTREALVALATVLRRRRRKPRFRALIATGTHRFGQRERREFEQASFGDCGFRIADCGDGKGVGHLRPERPGGCFAQKVPAPFSVPEIEQVTWHDASDASGLLDVAGVRMHPWVAAGRFLLPIGGVEPHYFAGVTGAHKTVTIGCMSREDIERNHAHALSPDSGVVRLEGNPVYDGIVQTLRRLQGGGKRILAINEVVCDSAVIAAAAGEPLEALKALLPTVQRVYLRQISQPVDLLRLRVPLPLGRNLYQADKALKNNHTAVRDGGGILLEADCPEGVGPDAFLNLLRQAGDYASAVRHVRDQGYKLGDHKAVKLRYLTDPSCRGVHVALVSSHIHRLGGPSLQRWGTQFGDANDSPTSEDVGHPPEDAPAAGIAIFKDVASATEWLLREVSGPIERGLVVEDAGHVSVNVKKSKSQKVETRSF